MVQSACGGSQPGKIPHKTLTNPASLEDKLDSALLSYDNIETLPEEVNSCFFLCVTSSIPPKRAFAHEDMT